MGLLGFGKTKRPAPAAAPSAADPDLDVGQARELQELAGHLDEDRELLSGALRTLQPGMGPERLAAALYGLCYKPLGLAAFFLALADYERDALHFPLYHEGGRSRPRPPRPLSSSPGLTGVVLQRAAPLYLRTLEEGMGYGVVLSEVEKESGLVPQSWFGVPLGADPAWGPRPFGVLGYQSFQPDAFTESRRVLMEALSEAFAFALRADPRLPAAGRRG